MRESSKTSLNVSRRPKKDLGVTRPIGSLLLLAFMCKVAKVSTTSPRVWSAGFLLFDLRRFVLVSVVEFIFVVLLLSPFPKVVVINLCFATKLRALRDHGSTTST